MIRLDLLSPTTARFSEATQVESDAVYPAEELERLRIGIISKMQKLRRGVSVLVMTNPADYNIVSVEIIRTLVERLGRPKGVVVTLDKPYETLREQMKGAGIDVEGLFFVDCISGTAAQQTEKGEDHVVLEGPEALTDLSIALSKILGDFQFLVILSLSTLREYHERRTVVTFAHQTITRARRAGATSVLLGLRGQHRDTLNAIIPACDEVIDLGGGALDRLVEEFFFR